MESSGRKGANECHFCRKPTAGTICDRCIYILAGGFFGIVPAMLVLAGIQAALHLSDEIFKRVLLPFIVSVPCTAIILIIARAIRGRGLPGGGGALARGGLAFSGMVLAGSLAIGLPVGCVFLIMNHFDEAETARVAAATARFKDAVTAATEYRTATKSTWRPRGGPLVYPLRSLIVYYDTGAAKLTWSLHYACPREWLATTKEDVRVVALISWDSEQLLGQIGNHSWHKYFWQVNFVDLTARTIVAREYITESDPEYAIDYHTPEVEKTDAVSAIRKTISFGQ